MSEMRVTQALTIEVGGQRLSFEPDDIVSVDEISTPRDLVRNDQGHAVGLGQCHLTVRLTFHEGRGPKWTEVGE
jgi:hypothetical protein